MNLEDLAFWTWEQLETAIASIPDDATGPAGRQAEANLQRLLAEQRYRQRRNYLGPAKPIQHKYGPGHSLNPKDL
ncbi:MAG: hypothetical protein HC888_07410 [Candidatus Competibacteraceae bacterium]|nr:hypothetical protein [Candidatus Competibacteraceae bacterium]